MSSEVQIKTNPEPATSVEVEESVKALQGDIAAQEMGASVVATNTEPVRKQALNKSGVVVDAEQLREEMANERP